MTTDEYMRVGGGVAPKVARHSKEAVYFDLLKNQSGKVFIRMIHTEKDKGTFSDIIIPLPDIYEYVKQYEGTNKPISATPLKKLFTDKDRNSRSFLVAVLLKIELFTRDKKNPKKYLVKKKIEWTEFETKMLAIDDERYTP